MHNLWFISRLEQYGCMLSMETFQVCEKEILVKQLLENMSSEFVLKLIIDMCFVFNIYNPDIWNVIIKFMLDSKMVCVYHVFIGYNYLIFFFFLL